MKRADCFIRRLATGVTLDEAERETIRRIATKMFTVPAGHDLITEGEAVRHGLIFEHGWGCRYALLADGRRQILQFLLPGDHVGEAHAAFELD